MKTKDFRVIQGMLVADANNQGGSGGTYASLPDKPQINSHTLEGNQSAENLGLVSLDVYDAEITTKANTDLSNVNVGTANSNKSVNVDSNGQFVYLDEGIHLSDFNTHIDIGTGHLEGSYINFAMINNPQGNPTSIDLSSGNVPINFLTLPKINGINIVTINDLVASAVSDWQTDIKIGSDLAANRLQLIDDNSGLSISTLSNSTIYINDLGVKNDIDSDIIEISTGASTIKISDVQIVISNTNKSLSLTCGADGNLYVNGKKVLTE